MFSKIVLCLVLVIVLVAPANAEGILPVGILAQTHSPVLIRQCISGITESEAGNSNYYIDFAGVFANRTGKDIKAFRLRFDVFGTFNEHLETLYGTEQDGVLAYDTDNALKSTGPTDIGGQIVGSADEYIPTWQFINTHDTAAYIVCSVDTVRFHDGHMWEASVKDSEIKKALSAAKPTQGHFWVKSDE